MLMHESVSLLLNLLWIGLLMPKAAFYALFFCAETNFTLIMDL